MINNKWIPLNGLYNKTHVSSTLSHSQLFKKPKFGQWPKVSNEIPLERYFSARRYTCNITCIEVLSKHSKVTFMLQTTTLWHFKELGVRMCWGNTCGLLYNPLRGIYVLLIVSTLYNWLWKVVKKCILKACNCWGMVIMGQWLAGPIINITNTMSTFTLTFVSLVPWPCIFL